MTSQHPITPPDDLVEQLRNRDLTWLKQITIAYQSGADMELEACCQALRVRGTRMRCLGANQTIEHLRAERRAKQPSLKEQALAELEEIMTELHDETGSAFTSSIIRRALEDLDD